MGQALEGMTSLMLGVIEGGVNPEIAEGKVIDFPDIPPPSTHQCRPLENDHLGVPRPQPRHVIHSRYLRPTVDGSDADARKGYYANRLFGTGIVDMGWYGDRPMVAATVAWRTSARGATWTQGTR